MALAKKKQDEKNLQLLKSLVGLSFNKQCFDCNQKGPTYVDLTIGSFICMSCSGILRGLNPPHRVKSITMSTFTDDEIEFIRSRGNFFCREVWLGNYNSDRASAVDLHNDQNKKDYLSVKYERKQWYVEPSPNLFQEAKQLTDSALSELEQLNQPQTRPGRSFSASNPIAPSNHHQNGSTPASASKMSIGNLPMPQLVEQPPAQSPLQTPAPALPPAEPQQRQIISLFDDDLETALRKQNVSVQQAAPPVFENQPPPPQQQQQQKTAAMFPVNFSAMEPTPFTKAAQLAAQNSPPVPTQQPAVVKQASPPAAAAPNFGGFADFDSAFGKDGQKATAPPPVIMAPPPDRYKALEELDDLLTLTGSTVAVNSGINWGSQVGGQRPVQPQLAHRTQQQPSFPIPSSSTTIGNTMPSFQASFNNSDPFNTASTFAAAGMAPPQMAAPPPYSAAAPFGHTMPQQTTTFPPAFGVPAQQQQQPAAFGVPVATQQTAFPSMVAPSQPQAFGAAGFGFGAFPPQQTPFGMAQNPQTVANPFLAAGAVQQQAQPSFQAFPPAIAAPLPAQQRPSFSNNPFLFN